MLRKERDTDTRQGEVDAPRAAAMGDGVAALVALATILFDALALLPTRDFVSPDQQPPPWTLRFYPCNPTRRQDFVWQRHTYLPVGRTTRRTVEVFCLGTGSPSCTYRAQFASGADHML
ncbi:hypothetical protein OPT61_g144 [Boeremia exigua]|uniref:Uncharacterized protein n=1 Tax=Boeremia exigua TaxID=749465 RepID=A0ACC2IV44_9PLEO|nr:hypothetical protein OPT61_g144 [Boeremia exigua]